MSDTKAKHGTPRSGCIHPGFIGRGLMSIGIFLVTIGIATNLDRVLM